MNVKQLNRTVSILTLAPGLLCAQAIRGHEVAPLKSWPAPLYWQPAQAEARAVAGDPAAGIPVPEATAPPNSLVFVGMTPCRVVDTRGAAGLFGGPSLIGGATRSFPLAAQTGNPCPIPANAQAYSLNVTVVPPGPLGYLTIWPQGVAQPVVSTLNDSFGQVLANAAIVPAGTPNGGVNVFALNNTDLVIDINGYYITQTGITLNGNSSTTPSLSFTGDPQTGLFSSGAGKVDITTAGNDTLTVNNGNVGIGVGNPAAKLQVVGVNGNPDAIRAGFLNVTYPSTPATSAAFVAGGGTSDYRLEIQNGHGRVNYYWNAFNNATGTPAPPEEYIVTGEPALRKMEATSGTAGALFQFLSAPAGTAGAPITWTTIGELNGASDVWFSPSGNNNDFFITTNGTTGIGTTNPRDKLEVAGELRVQDCVKNSGGTQIAGTCPSDERLKQNIEPFSPVLSKLVQLQPVHFDWRADEYPDYHFGDSRSYGLIAQEVEREFPELVSQDKQGFKAVNYSELPLLLLHGMRDLNAENRKMAARIEALEALLAGKTGPGAQGQ